MKEIQCTFLTLGDGDFSFSLDLATQLSANDRLIASGIDSRKDLFTKYKDAPFLLSQLQKRKVIVHHSINAISPKMDTEDDNNNMSADVVIFNHPHLGREDAQLHHRFLCHLFHAVHQKWLKPKGVFFLTLAGGQVERWQCRKAASKIHMVVLQETPFQPPPGTYYQQRRHQSGRSFASRTQGTSTRVALARESEAHLLKPHIWENPWKTETINLKPSWSCPDCERTFSEERALKSHIKAKHTDDDNAKKKRKRETHECKLCDRVFDNKSSFLDHVRAKHQGVHKDLSPATNMHMLSNNDNSDEHHEEVPGVVCEICDMSIVSMANHLLIFCPATVHESNSKHLPCRFCTKSFRDDRSLRQHENSCYNNKPNINAD